MKEWESPKLDGVPFERVNEDDDMLPLAPFTGEEIELVAKESDFDSKRFFVVLCGFDSKSFLFYVFDGVSTNIFAWKSL